VKVRGFRIELGDIETHLEQHPAVAQAVAHAHEGRLVAYVKPAGANGDGTAIWEDQWDLLYKNAIEQSGGAKLDQLDSVIAGWAGASDIEQQVTEWIDATAARIRKYGPRRIFEIGCGTGQILSRFAADAECYWAADISKVAIEALQKAHPLPQVKLFHRPADDFSDIPDGHFDTVVINSVAQYFPDAAYLARVLAGAAKALKPGGRIFLGDIQSNALLAAHHAEILRERAPAGSTCGQLREKLAQRLSRETELSLDPAWFDPTWFDQFGGFAHVEIQLRRGEIANETTTYHYDVILHIGEKPPLKVVTQWRQWDHLNLEQLEAILAEGPDALAIAGIPDARLTSPLGFLRALEHSPESGPLPVVPSPPPNALSTEQLFAAAEATGHRAHVRWRGNGSAGLLDVIFLPADSGALPLWPIQASPAPLANTPHHENPAADLAAALRQHLAAKLPDYMVPAAFVTLDQFPLTPNGKVDRKALPEPGETVESVVREVIAPTNDTERQLVEIWKQVLGLHDIGTTDDIFELGGDSILIFQITTRATRAGLALTPAQVFRLRTVAALAAELTTAPPAVAAAPSIQRVNRDAYRRKL
jgi:SAM-dependent methyltransferase